MLVTQFSGVLVKQFTRSYARNGRSFVSNYEHCQNYKRFFEYRKRLALWLREQSGQVAKACTKQFEFIAAQRIRRSLQIFHLYTRIWDEVALKEFMKAWKNRMMKNTRHFLMSSIGVTMYNWDQERISDKELNSYKQEIEEIYKLKDKTVVCAKCHLRIVIDIPQPDMKYCTCYGEKCNATINQNHEGWTPYIERQDMLIWRREEPNTQGLFSYKVYGSFSDVTAEQFLQTQIDIDYRKQWDSTARELQIVDTDPEAQKSINSGTDILYWETIWPRLFSNRDYVYQRRWVVDNEKRLIVIISKVTEHPSVPTRPGIYRVTTYWSYMVIRPYTEFHEPGIEFGLTYFDDPGVNIPSAVTSWVAMSGLPDFLLRMRQASMNYESYKANKEMENLSERNMIVCRTENETIQSDQEQELMNERTVSEDKTKDDAEKNETLILSKECEESDTIEEDTDVISSTDEGKGLLRYFFFTKLFV